MPTFWQAAWDQAGREFGRKNYVTLMVLRVLRPLAVPAAVLAALGLLAFGAWQGITALHITAPAVSVAVVLRWLAGGLTGLLLVSLVWRHTTTTGRIAAFGWYRPVPAVMGVGIVAVFALSLLIG